MGRFRLHVVSFLAWLTYSCSHSKQAVALRIDCSASYPRCATSYSAPVYLEEDGCANANRSHVVRTSIYSTT